MALLERERVMDLEKLMELQIGVHQLMEGATVASKSLEAVLSTLEGLVAQIPGDYQSSELKNLLGQIQGTLVREEYTQSDENTTKLTNLLIERIPAIDKEEGAMLYGIQPGHLMVDEPVDACTGNYLYEKTDLFLPGVTPLAFGRTYNSLDKSKGVLGRGWRHSFEECLQIKDNKYTVELNDGRKLLVTKTELKIQETGYCYHGGEDLLLWFDRAGNCMAKCSRGNLYFYKRDKEGRLVKVITSQGNGISISYQSDGRIEGITDHSGRSIIYCYEKKRLSSVTGPGENTENYTYEEQNRLHTVTDADEICLVSNVYDSRKRVISQNYFSAGKNSFVYQDESKSTRMQELRESILICQTDKRKNVFGYLELG